MSVSDRRATDSIQSRPQSWLGARARRVEDRSLLTGTAVFVDDIHLPGMVHAVLLRSPHPHAYLRAIDTSAAVRSRGVHAVFTQQDIDRLGFTDLPVIWVRAGQKNLSNPLLARDKVRYVGEPVAILVADSRALAEDAVELIEVEYEELPPVVDPLAALEDGAPRLFEEWGDNLCVTLAREGGDIEAAFADADVTLSERMRCQRYTGVPLETRGAVAAVDDADRVGARRVTLWTSTQVVHHARDVIAQVLDLATQDLRVIAPVVGGGFGPKDHAYPEEILTCGLAIVTGRPVKWIEDRQEHFLATVHAREQVHDIELAATRDGRILGVRDVITANLGAYCSNVGAGPVGLAMDMLPGPYIVPAYKADVRGVVTNKVPSGAYRGFGMTQSTFMMERMLDLLARELRLDPAEVRRRNLIPAEALPYESITGMRYDSGDYRRALDVALETVGYEEWRERQAALREQGRYIGIGISSYVEAAAFGPSRKLGVLGFAIAGFDAAVVKMDQQGRVTLYTGINSTGQSHRTTFAQVCASALGIALEDVVVIQGDTETSPYAPAGSIGSRGAAVAGGATLLASRKLKDKLVRVGAHMLEADPDDVDIEGGKVLVRGAPGAAIAVSAVARAALLGHDLPDGVTPGLDERHVYDPDDLTFPYATHVAVVEVDPGTGGVSFHRYVIAHDCGVMINPTVVEGQIHGGVAQGVGGALLEELTYSDDGQPVAASFMDYLLPTAADVPPLEVLHIEIPTPVTPGGMKGMGEGGAIGPPAAIGNAIEDALAPFGVKVLSTPLSPSKINELIRQSRQREE
jgi:carbon-monoxide dehydrogenase large subunit